MKKWSFLIAGIINLIAAVVHAVVGQLDLMHPLLTSSLNIQQKAEWTGVWHFVTMILFFTSLLILRAALKRILEVEISVMKMIGMLYILAGSSFVFSSLYFAVLAPQWILLLPIGIFLLMGIRKTTVNAE